MQRSRHVSMTLFNLNRNSKQEVLTEFRFRTSELPKIADLTGWHRQPAKCCTYVYGSITATYIVLRKLALPCRWYNIAKVFCMRHSKMREVFWEEIKCFMNAQRVLQRTLKTDLRQERTAMYEDAIKEKGALIATCFGFIDCTKIWKNRSRGAVSMQRSCYSGHKQIHCLVYQTIKTLE